MKSEILPNKEAHQISVLILHSFYHIVSNADMLVLGLSKFWAFFHELTKIFFTCFWKSCLKVHKMFKKLVCLLFS